MTMQTGIAQLLWLDMAVLMLWAVFRWLILPTMTDSLRAQLFAIRREMFLFMADGGVDPDHPGYGRVRSYINALIRHAESMSLIRSVVGVLAAGKGSEHLSRGMNEAVDALPPEARAAISSFRHRATRATSVFMIVKSPVGWGVVFIATVFDLIAFVGRSVGLVKSGSNAMKEAKGKLEQRAEKETQILRCIEDDDKNNNKYALAA